MQGTRFKPLIRDCLGSLNREVRIALTPVPRNKTWLFLVGCYNSGTTLLAELLGQHPDIAALPTEGHFITDQFIKDYDVGLPRMWVEREDLFRLTEQDEGPDVIRLKKEWAMRLDCSRPVLLEKSPPNSAKVRWLQKHFENAHFVGIVRNGYAVAEGISRKAEPHHLEQGWPIAMSARQWARSNQLLKADADALDHFMWVRYEDLTADSGKVLNAICDFVGVSAFTGFQSDQDLAIHERHERIRNMNEENIRNLTQQQITVINEIAGEMLDEFGYRRL